MRKVLVPVLGDQYGEVLERGELKLVREGGAFFVKYWEHSFPVTPRQVPRLLGHRLEALRAELGAGDVTLQELESILTALEKLAPRAEVSPDTVAERAREKEVAKRRLAALFEASPRIGAFVDENVRIYNGTPGDPRSFDLLDELLEHQAYRLAYWRVAGEEINYRRFFDINTLAAIRMEDPRVFDDTHQLVFRLIAEGKIAGLRIDHPDGLYAPSAYFRRLQRGARRALRRRREDPRGPREACRRRGGSTAPPATSCSTRSTVCSSTGARAAPSASSIARFTGIRQKWRDAGLREEAHAHALVDGLRDQHAVAPAQPPLREQPAHARLHAQRAQAVRWSTTWPGCPIYRTYVEGDDAATIEQRDRQYIEATVRAAKRASRELNRDDLRLLALDPAARESRPTSPREFVRKLQQVTGPVTAKAIEDTAFYIYNRLVSLNEVGGDPQRFGVTVEELHRANAERLADWPGSLNTTATHDTKRGEDVRLRIDALSEIPAEWEQRLQRWAGLGAAFKTTEDGALVPDANVELLVYQTLVGTFPDDGRVTDAYRARIAGYLDKALKEAKVHSSWTNPDEAYEKATRDFAGALLSSQPFLADFVPFTRRVAAAARVSSLAQVALKVSSPGVPDVYQGCELWDLSLVDPDNRRPVDYELRHQMLAALARRTNEGAAARLQLARELSQPAALVDGRAKLLLLRQALRFRRAHGPLFLEGEYVPLAVAGADAGHVVAFARRRGGEHVVCVAPRLTLTLLDRGNGRLALDAQVALPDGLHGALTDVVTGRRHDARARSLTLTSLLHDFPVALVAGPDAPAPEN